MNVPIGEMVMYKAQLLSLTPAQSAWFHRPDEILEAPRGMESSLLDRLAAQKLVGPRDLDMLIVSGTWAT